MFIVITIDKEGRYAPAAHPFVHPTAEAARLECERLAAQYPGERFSFWQRCGVAVKREILWQWDERPIDDQDIPF